MSGEGLFISVMGPKHLQTHPTMGVQNILVEQTKCFAMNFLPFELQRCSRAFFRLRRCLDDVSVTFSKRFLILVELRVHSLVF